MTVLLLALSFPPAGFDFLAWVALAPLLVVLGVSYGKRGLFLLWAAGMVFGCVGFFWVRHVTWLGTVLLGLYLSLYFVAFCASVRWLSCRRNIPMALAAPIVWTGLEYFRGMFLSGLPWVFLAHTQYEALPVVQLADLTGAAGVTFWIVAVNGAVADAIRMVWHTEDRPAAGRVLAGAVLVLLMSGFGQWYGAWRLDAIVVKKGPRIAVVQGNIPQDVKNLLTKDTVTDIFFKHLALTDEAQATSPPPDLVIWPETMAPPGLFDDDYRALCEDTLAVIDERCRQRQWDDTTERDLLYGQATELRAEISSVHEWRRRLARPQQLSDLLIGSGHYSVETNGDRYEIGQYNSVYHLSRGGRGSSGRYDKIHLVPFGEYVPLRSLIGWVVGPMIPYKDGLKRGREPVLFEVKGWRFAPTICFEDSFAALVADFGRGKDEMDFIVNVTNEGWFKDGAELDLHLAIAVFRAVECRAGFVRSANTGISAFISPTGRVLSTLVVDGKDREVAGVLHGVATTTETPSPYLRAGEWFGRTCAAAAGCCMLIPLLCAVKSRVARRFRRHAPGR